MLWSEMTTCSSTAPEMRRLRKGGPHAQGQSQGLLEQQLVFGVASQKVVHHVQTVLNNNATVCSPLIPADKHRRM